MMEPTNALLQEARDAIAQTYPFDTGKIADLMRRLDAALSAPDQAPVAVVELDRYGQTMVMQLREMPVGTKLFLAPPATQAGELLRELVAVEELKQSLNALARRNFSGNLLIRLSDDEREMFLAQQRECERRKTAVVEAARQYVAGQAAPSGFAAGFEQAREAAKKTCHDLRGRALSSISQEACDRCADAIGALQPGEADHGKEGS